MVDIESIIIACRQSIRRQLQRVRRVARTQSAALSLFSLREIVLIGWMGIASVIALNQLFQFISREFIDRQVVSPMVLPRSWPISVFEIRPFNLTLELSILLVGASALVFILTTTYVLSEHDSVAPVLGAGTVLLVLTNLLQGGDRGLAAPLTYGESYYQAAVQITDPIAFIQAYEQSQLGLPLHASTHPPGSVLIYYVFEQLLGSPTGVSVTMAVVSLVVSGYLFHRLLLMYFEPGIAQYMTLLFALLPAVQIYYLSSLDAVIVALFLGTVYCFTRESRVVAGIGTFCCLTLAAWHTFMAIFLIPVLSAIALYRRDRIGLLALQFVGLTGWYLGIDLLLDYNYFNSFQISSKQQAVAATQHFTPTEQQVRTSNVNGVDGILIVSDPLKYVYTRIENVAEIALFFTPYLCVLWARGLSTLRGHREAFVLFAVSLVSLSGLFAAGVYHTGETARGAMYIYPFLLLPVAAVLRSTDLTRRDKWVLATLVFTQTVFMQVIGSYLW